MHCTSLSSVFVHSPEEEEEKYFGRVLFAFVASTVTTVTVYSYSCCCSKYT